MKNYGLTEGINGFLIIAEYDENGMFLEYVNAGTDHDAIRQEYSDMMEIEYAAFCVREAQEQACAFTDHERMMMSCTPPAPDEDDELPL
jgi:hypothetical protein